MITYVNRIKSGRVDKFQGIDNVAITYSRYFCYEEIFLSFKYLTEFCGVKYGGNSLDMQKARRIHHILHNYFVTVSNRQGAVYSDYLPLLNKISQGFAIIISSLLAAMLGAYFFPIKDKEDIN